MSFSFEIPHHKMMLELFENVYCPSTGRSVPPNYYIFVLKDPFKREMHSSEKLSLISSQKYPHVGFGNDAQR